MFGKRVSKDDLTAFVMMASQDFLSSMVEEIGGEDDLQTRAERLNEALHKAEGIDYLAEWVGKHIKDACVCLGSAAAVDTIREMIDFNARKIRGETTV